jgi:hypothetical protein
MGPDMGEVLHSEDGHPRLKGMGDDGLAGDVVDVADMPLLPPGDGPELPFGSTATVGLESAAGGKVSIPVMPEFPATKDLTGTDGSEIVLPHIQAHGEFARKGVGIREVEHQVQIPRAIAPDEPGFLRDAGSQKDDLVAGRRKEFRQFRKRFSLLRRSQELEGSSPYHFVIFSSIWMGVKHPFLPGLKDGVSWTIR